MAWAWTARARRQAERQTVLCLRVSAYRDVNVHQPETHGEPARVEYREASGHAVWSTGCERFQSWDTSTHLSITASSTELLDQDIVY